MSPITVEAFIFLKRRVGGAPSYREGAPNYFNFDHLNKSSIQKLLLTSHLKVKPKW